MAGVQDVVSITFWIWKMVGLVGEGEADCSGERPQRLASHDGRRAGH